MSSTSGTSDKRTVWLCTETVTVRVEVRGKVIVRAAPMVRKFVGQRFDVLVGWMIRRFGPVEVEETGVDKAHSKGV